MILLLVDDCQILWLSYSEYEAFSDYSKQLYEMKFDKSLLWYKLIQIICQSSASNVPQNLPKRGTELDVPYY